MAYSRCPSQTKVMSNRFLTKKDAFNFCKIALRKLTKTGESDDVSFNCVLISLTEKNMFSITAFLGESALFYMPPMGRNKSSH